MKSYMANMFGQSPIHPLQKHMKEVLAAIQLLKPVFIEAQAGNFDKVDVLHQQVVDQEHLADSMKREIRLHLTRTLFMPVSRQDILEILRMQDRIANKSRDISELILSRKMSFPSSMQQGLQELLCKSIEAAEQTNQAIVELGDLVETGFGGGEVNRVENMINLLNQLEHETDEKQHELRRTLFAMEKSLPPVDVVFLYRLVEWMGELADIAQCVGSRLQILLAR